MKTFVVIKHKGQVHTDEVEGKNLWLYYQEMVNTYGEPKYLKAIYQSNEVKQKNK
jgi:radical SAM superfamily enzyme